MSNALVIADVTAILIELVTERLVTEKLSGYIGGTVTVSALSPDLINIDTNGNRQLNLFLYRLTQNTGWQNSCLPSRDSRGDRIANPPLALDLHYLVSAYAKSDMHAEVILGHAMQLFHEIPVLTRNTVRKIHDKWAGDTDVLLKELAESQLPDQVELVKISPQVMNLEEMAKLWSAFQAKYRPTAAYTATVVLIETYRPARSPLPVLSRGLPDYTSGRDEGVRVRPALAEPSLPYPVLLRVIYPDQQLSACLGDTVTVTGLNLDGIDVKVRFENKRLGGPVDLRLTDVKTGELSFQIPDRPEDWPAGFYTISALIQRPGKTYHEATNQVPFALALKWTLPSEQPITGTPNAEIPDLVDVTMILACVPHVRPGQRVTLLLNDREIPAKPFDTATSNVSFEVEAVVRGDFLVRLRVDGVDSHFIDYTRQPSEFIAASRVTIQ